jgi:hypothetical protein
MSLWVFPSMKWKDNKFNFNDNTSGIIALLYLAQRVANEHPEIKDRLLFVFSDNEEAGVLGAKKLSKRLLEKRGTEKFKDIVHLNFDCIGGRDDKNFLATNSLAGLEVAKEIASGADGYFTVFRFPVLNMDSHAFKKLKSVSFCAATSRFGTKNLLESKDIHTNKDNLLNTEQLQKHADAAYAYLVKKGEQ